MTAAAGLYNTKNLHLPPPRTSNHPTTQNVLIWGGSSNVGSAAIQLALASGLEIVTTASRSNHGLVKSLGVKQVFDHNMPSVVDDLVNNLKGKDVVGAFDGG